MISKIFQPPIYDFGKVLMHILFFSFLKKKKIIYLVAPALSGGRRAP